MSVAVLVSPCSRLLRSACWVRAFTGVSLSAAEKRVSWPLSVEFHHTVNSGLQGYYFVDFVLFRHVKFSTTAIGIERFRSFQVEEYVPRC